MTAKTINHACSAILPSPSAGSDSTAPAVFFAAELEALSRRMELIESALQALRPQIEERMLRECQEAIEAGRERRDWTLLTAFIGRYGEKAVVEMSAMTRGRP